MKLDTCALCRALLMVSLVVSLGCEDDTPACIAESACTQVSLVHPGEICEPSDSPALKSEEDVAAAKCMLEALRDGDPGPVSIHEAPTENPGWCGFRRSISVTSHRNVIVVEGVYEDLGGDNNLRKGKLKSPATFQKCLDDGPDGYVACLIDPIDFETAEVDCECEYYCMDVNEQSI